jgi:porphyrinogen peroxidase
MTKPQPGIIPEPGAHARFLILNVRDPIENGARADRVLAGVPKLVERIGNADPRAKLVCTVGLGSEYWDVISPAKRPNGLRPFRAVDTAVQRAPNTGGDVLLHITSQRADLNFELAMRLVGQLGDAVVVMDEVIGFRYLDSRDLTGFIDGTENPTGKKARTTAALIGPEERAFAGGSYVFTQRYVHDLKRWAEAPLKEQEGAIGRRKRDSKELSGKSKPPTAHISRVVIEENGEELQIVRHSFPYGTVSEAGLFFIAYTKSLDTTEKMLARIMGNSDDGRHDHLMDFTRAVSGATFFAPALDILRSLAR